jgi:hypothetical protein
MDREGGWWCFGCARGGRIYDLASLMSGWGAGAAWRGFPVCARVGGGCGRLTALQTIATDVGSRALQPSRSAFDYPIAAGGAASPMLIHGGEGARYRGPADARRCSSAIRSQRSSAAQRGRWGGAGSLAWKANGYASRRRLALLHERPCRSHAPARVRPAWEVVRSFLCSRARHCGRFGRLASREFSRRPIDRQRLWSQLLTIVGLSALPIVVVAMRVPAYATAEWRTISAVAVFAAFVIVLTVVGISIHQIAQVVPQNQASPQPSDAALYVACIGTGLILAAVACGVVIAFFEPFGSMEPPS